MAAPRRLTPPRLLVRASLATLAVLVVGSALASAPALAGTGYAFSSAFGGSCEVLECSPTSAPLGVAVNQTTGDVYVANLGTSIIGQYTSAGVFVRQVEVPGAGFYQATVGPEGNVYAAGNSSGVLYKFNAELGEKQELLTGLGGPVGAAIDSSGDIYVGLRAEGTVAKFNAKGEPVDAEGTVVGVGENTIVTGLNTPLAVAVTPDGKDLYVGGFGGSVEYELQGNEYKQATVIDAASTQGLVRDPGSGNVFVDQGGTEIVEYSPSGGKPLAQFGSEEPGRLGGGYGVAVSDTTGDVYVGELGASNDVFVFAPGSTPEEPKTEAAAPITTTTATLHGELKATGRFYFAYNKGASCAGGQRSTEEEAAAGSVSAAITGLEPATQYTVCLVAKNKFGATQGAEVPFTTLGEQPAVEGEKSSGLAATQVTLEGAVNPNNQVTHYFFEYGTSKTLAGATSIPASPGAELSASFGAVGVSQTPTGLLSNTRYYYRLVAENATGKNATTPIQELLTLAAAPECVASEQSGSKAKLAGTFNPNGETIEYFFEYGLGGFEFKSPVEGPLPTATGSAPLALSQPAEKLIPHAEYQCRMTIKNGTGEPLGGTSQPGPVGKFTSASLPPTVLRQSARVLSQTEAKLEAGVNPNNEATQYHYEYGTSPKLEGATTVTPTPSELAAEYRTEGLPTTAQTLTGLQLNTTYYYRLVAENGTPPASKGPVGESIASFTTLPNAITEGASDVTSTGATVRGSFKANPGTYCYFEYGQSYGYGTRTVPTETSAGTCTGSLKGLEAGNTYNYRLVVQNSCSPPPAAICAGSAYGANAKLTTPAAPEALGTLMVTNTSALLEFALLPAPETSYQLEYGTSESYGTNIAIAPAGAPGSGVALQSMELAGLTPGTIYYYRYAAQTPGGTEYGYPEQFETAPPQPQASTGAPENLTAETVTLTGTVNPEGQNTTYQFQYGTSTAYGAKLPAGPVYAGQGFSTITEAAGVGGLAPSTVYHYRILAHSTGGTVYGADQTFTTPAPLALTGPVITPPPPKPGPKPLTNAQKLIKALKACHKLKSHKKRTSCERAAHKKYAPAKKKN